MDFNINIIIYTVQQSSFYGFASMFPKKYTQALMAGESMLYILLEISYIYFNN